MDSPRLGFTQAAYLFYPATPETLGLDDDRANATVGKGCQISSSARIGTGATIGAGTMVGANAVIGNGVTVGENCFIGPNTTISHAVIGKHVQIYPGVVIGSQGFGFVPSPRGMLRVPQLGRVIIGDDVEIGSNSTIDRGAIGDTVIGQGTVIDNQVQVGHNVQIGRFCILSGQAGVAGSTRIGDGVQIGGGSSITGHITIGAGAKIAGMSGVAQDVEPGSTVGGYPAIPIRNWHRQTIGLARMFSRKT
jgi:UDP-3-O-[3-hydroxymyristoyl] glucosamine N-acyltransferase